MFQNKKILALIPARGGSKGLPGKNTKILAGLPLIAWTIRQAKASRFIDNVAVSTDNGEIAQIAKQHGAEIPFMRPAHLATDQAATMDVVLHAIQFFEDAGTPFDILVLLEPTSPLRETHDIDTAIEQLEANPDALSIVGIARVESHHPDFLVRLKDSFLRPYADPDFTVKRRQDIETLYFYEGSLYISYPHALKKIKNFYHKKTIGYIMPKWKSYEIDDLSDFTIVEALIKNRPHTQTS